ncbi:energy transducer TonB [Mucilaginibacter glaciei]|uniref:Energy transducer TonB n=1 Tax=Mucilaginibacter glaciei TaxID=2772109 RepID=A0A926NZQ1_9SPHI|nr:energy transducer TonB [Mucilaginibacter glaciei]MBD1394918.1 energy transducer TonB [Mucilaginibacter glaciei]
MNWLHYLAEANIYLGVFYLCYCLFLTNETHYTLSRIYLLFSSVIAFVLPVTQLSVLKPSENLEFDQSAAYVNTAATMRLTPPPPPPEPPAFTWQDGLFYMYLAGAAIALIVFAFRLYQLYRLSRSDKQVLDNSCQIIHLPNDNTAFSFFNYLFIGTNIAQSDTIIAHELVHIRQRHSWDIMLLEVLKVINWFNPFIYLTQRSLKTVHEYIADEQTAAYERDALTYSSFLLNNAYGIQGSTIAHSFFNYNLLKKRIIMLNKNRSGKLARLKYLAMLPLCGGMLCASTLAFAKDYGWVDLTPKKAIAEKPKVKRLKIKDGDMTFYSDNISVKEKDGSRKKYLVGTITPTDISYLLTEHKLIVVIIEVDSAANRANPSVVFPDTIKHKLPPPPPAPPKTVVKEVPLLPPPPTAQDNLNLITYMGKHVRYPAVARNKNVTGNILLSFKLDKTHKVTDVKVENGIGSGCDEEAVRTLKSYAAALPKAAGSYKMMVTYMLVDGDDHPINEPKQIEYKIASRNDFVGQVRIAGYIATSAKRLSSKQNFNQKSGDVNIVIDTPVTPKQITKRPPSSPPAPPKIKAEKRVTSIFKSDKTQGGLAIAPPLPGSNKEAKLTPPAPYDPAYVALYNYMARAVRYPQAAFAYQVTGNVILSYLLDANHKITNIKVLNGIGSGCDEETIRAMKSFTGVVTKTPGQYYMTTIFALQGYTKKFEPIGDIRFKPNYAGTIIIMGYPKIVSSNKLQKATIGLPSINKTNASVQNETYRKNATLTNDKAVRLLAPRIKKLDYYYAKNLPKFPLIIVNGKEAVFKNQPLTIKHLVVTATDSTITHTATEIFAMNKWGDKSKNGVIELFGETSVSFN